MLCWPARPLFLFFLPKAQVVCPPVSHFHAVFDPLVSPSLSFNRSERELLIASPILTNCAIALLGGNNTTNCPFFYQRYFAPV